MAGNSTGGGIALDLASRGIARSAIALAPIGFWSARERAFCQASVRATRALGRTLRPVMPVLARSAVARAVLLSQLYARPGQVAVDEIVQEVDALVGAGSFEATCDSFAGYLAPLAATDHAQVTVCWGDRDRLLLPRQARRARRRLPRAQHVLIPGAGHLMMSDDPGATADVILAGCAAAS